MKPTTTTLRRIGTCSTAPTWTVSNDRQRSSEGLLSVSKDSEGVVVLELWNVKPGVRIRVNGKDIQS